VFNAPIDLAAARAAFRGPAGPDAERCVVRAGEFVADEDRGGGSLEAAPPAVALARRGLVGADIRPLSSVCTTMSG
jgi:hypothetical protein